MSQFKLSILICTINDRITAVPDMLLPPCEEVCYVISMQYTDDLFLSQIPSVLYERKDVFIYPYFGAGLSANRNHAFKHCTTELAVIADDDVHYSFETLKAAISLADAHPTIDIFCLQVYNEYGHPIRSYSDKAFDYAYQPKGNYFVSYEILLRTDATLPTFDVRFGLGAPYLGCGEEEVFLYQAHRLGANVRYFPQLLCWIPSTPTTGSQFCTNRKVRHAKGAVLYMFHGLVGALLRITLAAFRLPKGVGRVNMWWDMVLGIRYIWQNPLNEGIADDIPLDFHPIDITKLP